MVQVVSGDARQEGEVAHLVPPRRRIQLMRRQVPDGFAQQRMHTIEQLGFGSPGTLRHLLWPTKPVRTFERKRSALRAAQAPPRGVLPIRRMNSRFPDI